MNQTMWIDNMGQLIPCASNGHYAYIQQNFGRMFGREPLNESEIHDKPYEMGWIHIQNHMNTFNVRGNPQAVSNRKSKIRDLIFERLMDNREFTVNIEYNNKARINPFGSMHSYKMPDQYDELRSVLG